MTTCILVTVSILTHKIQLSTGREGEGEMRRPSDELI